MFTLQHFLNELIKAVCKASEQGIVYDVIGVVGGFVALFFCIWLAKKMKIPFKKSIFIIFFEILFLMVALQVVMWMQSGFTVFGRKNIVSAFVYTPIMTYLFYKIYKMSWNTLSDLMTFPFLIMHAIARIACIFTGCCYGYAWEGGIYNVHLDANAIPVQLIESIMTIVLVFFLWRMLKNNEYKACGKLMPLSWIWYGCLRFLTEFLHDNEKIFVGLSSDALNSVFMVAMGIIWLVLFKKMKNKVEEEANGQGV